MACSATVLVTVVSTPAPDRACVDGGYKTFGADPMLFTAARVGGLGSWSPSYGSVVGRPRNRRQPFDGGDRYSDSG